MRHLCEACDRYGNCICAFLDPFIMILAVKLNTGASAGEWEPDNTEESPTTHVEGCALILQPHVHQSPM